MLHLYRLECAECRLLDVTHCDLTVKIIPAALDTCLFNASNVNII